MQAQPQGAADASATANAAAQIGTQAIPPGGGVLPIPGHSVRPQMSVPPVPPSMAPSVTQAQVPHAAVTARSQAQAVADTAVAAMHAQAQALVAAVQTTIVPASTTAATAASAAAALSPLDSYEDGSFDPDLGEDDFDPGNANLDDSEWSNVQQNGAAAVTNFPGPPIVSPTFWAPPAHPPPPVRIFRLRAGLPRWWVGRPSIACGGRWQYRIIVSRAL